MSAPSVHDDWLSLIEISGPFLAVPVLKEAFPQGLEELDSTQRKRLRQAYEEWREALELEDAQFAELHTAWIDEVLFLAKKFPNFYIDTSAYAAHRLPPELVDYMRGSGRTRVLFGTNWPMLSAQRCLERLDDLDLDAEARDLFLSGNATRVFGV